MKTIVRMLYGSHLYGTSTPQSDFDYKEVYIPEADDVLLQQVKDSINTGKAKEFGEKNNPGDKECEKFSLQKFLEMLAEGQTAAVDMIFAPDSVIKRSSPLWEKIRQNKHKLLTKRSAAFVGYCRQQGNKYGLKGSRVGAARAATELLARAIEAHGALAHVGEIEIDLRTILGEHTDIIQQPVNKAGDVGTFFVCCNRMVDFHATLKHAHDIYSGVLAGYGKRALLAETNEGVDWKALSHAIRVGTEAIELMTYGRVTLPLPNAAHVRDIKVGLIPYKEVAAEIEDLLVLVEAATRHSMLPDEADQEFIEGLVREAYLKEIAYNYDLA